MSDLCGADRHSVHQQFTLGQVFVDSHRIIPNAHETAFGKHDHIVVSQCIPADLGKKLDVIPISSSQTDLRAGFPHLAISIEPFGSFPFGCTSSPTYPSGPFPSIHNAQKTAWKNNPLRPGESIMHAFPPS
jgi:hypothetical protein